MVTIEYCETCEGWRQFHKEGRNPPNNIPWKCETCGWETLRFPKHENPITWVLTGKRPPSLIKED